MRKKIAILLLLGSTTIFADSIHQPQLILQIVVDQLRGDLIHQYQAKFTDDGFNYLLKHSLDFQNAHHPHAYTVTCVGHATIATGSYPSLHGIIANDWFNRDNKKVEYCVEDLSTDILPTTRTKKDLAGRSARNLLASTLSDEIVLAQKGQSYAVSLKDRAAITLAGHAGKAFWFDKENGGFVTSKYYYSNYPEWVNEWNKHYEAKNETWSLSTQIAGYRFANAPIFKHRFPIFGQTFPHQTGAPDNPDYYKLLSMTPNADELTADFALQLLKNEKLGKKMGQADYLAISFSSVDAIGHQFGPNSLESEDNLLRLDKTLGKLLKNIDQQVGLQNTLIVLTADHGVTDSPTYLTAHQMNVTAALDETALQKTLETSLKNLFGLPPTAIQAINLPYIYLDHQLINNQHINLRKVREDLTEILNQQPGIFQAFSLPLTSNKQSWLSAKVDKMFFPARAGDIYVVAPPYQLHSDSNNRVDHGTPWQYDSYVPLLFVNPAFKAQRIARPASTTDIASTLAAILMIKQPSAAIGRPLQEVVNYFLE